MSLSFSVNPALGKIGKLAFGCMLSLAIPAFAADAAHPSHVATANPKVVGTWSPDILSPELIGAPVARGANPVENPSDLVGWYGYNKDGLPMVPAPGDMQTATHNVEAHKTEPDKNTYLVLRNQRGADPDYNYGKHFLFQGHEIGLIGHLTRINLDADGAHRVTLMADHDIKGAPLPVYDGSTWYPFSRHILLTAELGANGGVWQATLGDEPSTNFEVSEVEDISGVFGRGGYEGIQADPWGNVIVVEDVGGPTGAVNTHARQPNSFVYRLIPYDPSDLKKGGKLQALQVLNGAGQPIIFHAGQADADILSNDVKELRTYNHPLWTKWVTIHDTATNGFTPFDANAAAKAAKATPFKRPENGLFRPGSHFTQFVFDETGDTNALTEAGSLYGGFGAIFNLTTHPRSDWGKIELVYRGDVAHTGLDNCAFWSKDKIVFVEDAGDGLHAQRNALDSAYLFDLRVDYSSGAQPVRILAEGRDPSATTDSALQGTPGFFNDGDNEITGFHVSDGDPTVGGLLGAKNPRVFEDGWRVFYTAQHGMNITNEILPAVQNNDDDDDHHGRGHDRD
jgi:hypothetical protein